MKQFISPRPNSLLLFVVIAFCVLWIWKTAIKPSPSPTPPIDKQNPVIMPEQRLDPVKNRADLLQPQGIPQIPIKQAAITKDIPTPQREHPALSRLDHWLNLPYQNQADQHKSQLQIILGKPIPHLQLHALWLKYLSDHRWQTRKLTAYSIAASGKIIKDNNLLQRLLELLRDDIWQVRVQALRSLANTDQSAHRRVQGLILPMLGDSSWQIRQQAIDTLRALGELRLSDVPMLEKLVRDSQWPVRVAIAGLIPNIRPQTSALADHLLILLSDRDPAVQYSTAQVLIDIGREAKQICLKAIRSDNVKLRQQAVAILVGLWLSHHNQDILQYFEQSLWQLWPISRWVSHLNQDILQTLTTALDDSNAQVQESAIEAIARIGPHAKSAIPKLIKFLYSEDVALRTMAIWALQRVGSEAVAELQRVLQSPILHAKLAAAHVLNGIGPSAAAAAPALLDTLLDHDWQVRREAAWALYRLGPNGARYIPNSMIEILINALQDHQWNIRFCLIHVLGWLGPKSKDMTGWYGSQKLTTAQALQKFAKDPDQRVSKAARHALNLVIKPLSQPTPQ